MVKVKDAATRRRNYEASLGTVPAKYQAGIQSTTGWKDSAIQGQGLYEEKMRDANVLARREKGLQRVNEADWKNKAAGIGAQRIASGMKEGAEKQSRNYEPYAQALSSLELPPRSADPMANIDGRVKPVVQRMVDTKNQQG